MWSAIFGLIGVIVGALLALWSQYVLERRRERRRMRGVARLIEDELREGLMGAQCISVAHTCENPSEMSRGLAAVNDDVWREHRATLSEHLPRDEHSVVELAQRHRRAFINRMTARHDTDETRLDEVEWVLLEDFIVETKRAALVLAKASGVGWPTRRRMKREFVKYEKDHGRRIPPDGPDLF